MIKVIYKILIGGILLALFPVVTYAFSQTFTNGQGETITIPAGVTTVTFTATGGNGGSGAAAWQDGGGGGGAFAWSPLVGWIVYVGGGGGAGMGGAVSLGGAGGSTAGNGVGLGGASGGLAGTPNGAGGNPGTAIGVFGGSKGAGGAGGVGGTGGSGSWCWSSPCGMMGGNSGGGAGGWLAGGGGANVASGDTIIGGSGGALYAGGGNVSRYPCSGCANKGPYSGGGGGGGGGYGGGGGGSGWNSPGGGNGGGGGSSYSHPSLSNPSVSGRSIAVSVIGQSIYLHGGTGGTGVAGVSGSQKTNPGGPGTITISWVDPTTGTVSVSSNISSSWTITGPATITGSGTSQTSASKPTGTYTITWGAVAGYATPASQSLTLTSSGTISFSGNYSLNSYTVSATAGAGGTISPASRTISYGSTTTFTVTPNAGYTASASGCGGSLSGTIYTTGAITGACTVSATYTLINVFPTPPIISGPTTLITGHSGTYSFVSTDPQGDQVRYGIDWNMDGTADNWLPVFPNYEPSGTNLSMSYTWSTTGSKQFQALAQDYPGNNSAWATYTITVSDPQPCTAGVVDSVNGWAPTCSTSATCLTPPSPAQLTNQSGIQIGLCPTPEYTGNTYRACSTATITCTPGPFCGDSTCNGSETILTCPADCKAKYQQF